MSAQFITVGGISYPCPSGMTAQDVRKIINIMAASPMVVPPALRDDSLVEGYYHNTAEGVKMWKTVEWGEIGGTLTEQDDLVAAINAPEIETWEGQDGNEITWTPTTATAAGLYEIGGYLIVTDEGTSRWTEVTFYYDDNNTSFGELLIRADGENYSKQGWPIPSRTFHISTGNPQITAVIDGEGDAVINLYLWCRKLA